jgi:DNA-binding PadR family transcriptional regulator
VGQAVGEFELITLLAVARTDPDAYGVTICRTLEERTSRNVTLGAIYKTLGRLESKGLVVATITPPTAERGGRRKKVYALTEEGRSAVRSTLSDLRHLAQGLEPELGTP